MGTSPPATPTVEEFWTALQKSNLLSADQLKSVALDAGKDHTVSAAPLARILVERGLITRWQAEQLFNGRTQFFIDDFRILDSLGTGSMGSVYRAQAAGQTQMVALKVLAPNLATNAEAIGRFRREAQLAATLRHPNIIAAYKGDQAGSRLYMAMELLAGQDLKHWLTEKGPLAVPFACECVAQAATGLQYAFDNGMLHRDIKPANLFITWNNLSGRPIVKILDLGLARFMTEARDKRLTLSGQIIGTPDYIAPESARNTKNSDIRSDIYSLGATLYELISGSIPFPGANMVEKLTARLSRDPKPLRELRSDVPPSLEQIVVRMMDRDPNQRFSLPAEVVRALDPFRPRG